MEYLTCGAKASDGLARRAADCGAFGQGLESYLKTCVAHKIKGVTPFAGLELSVGTRVLEVKGVVVGLVARRREAFHHDGD